MPSENPKRAPSQNLTRDPTQGPVHGVHGPNPTVFEILQRMADDSDFANEVERDPPNALRRFSLSPIEISRLEQTIAAIRQRE
jgi:hypothetical protein